MLIFRFIMLCWVTATLGLHALMLKKPIRFLTLPIAAALLLSF